MSIRIMMSATLMTTMLAAAGFSAPASAGTTCDDAAIADKLPKLPDGCQTERISASGNQRPTLYWAQKSVEDHWEDQVINKFGERFADPAHAACAKQECSPSTIAGFTRCTFSGFPCASKPHIEELIELTSEEISELQRLLNKQGAGLNEDGRFGGKTHDALVKWLKKHNISDEGEPTRENLERLRKG